MPDSPKVEPTTRAYTLKLTGEGDWRQTAWNTHVIANCGAQAWGDWLLTLRGGLSASLADDAPERRVLLALSWISVESPGSLVPQASIVVRGADPADERLRRVLERFHTILERLEVGDRDEWIAACQPALTARIRDDAVWVDRSGCFAALQEQFPGLTASWAEDTLFSLLGGADDYFSMPDDDGPAAEPKDFVQKAGGWLSRNWGAGEKSNSAAISTRLKQLAFVPPPQIVGRSAHEALASLLQSLGQSPTKDADARRIVKQLKQLVGWKGRPSKGAMALTAISEAEQVSDELWQKTRDKLMEESRDQAGKSREDATPPVWMNDWRTEMEQRLGMPYRTTKDLIWEHGVVFDHALRRVSSAHTWIKRAEVERRRFAEDAAKRELISATARDWLDAYCEQCTGTSGASGDYCIRKAAIDGWDRILQAWADLGPDSTRQQRIEAARDVQANLSENEKFGDAQLFAGVGDADAQSLLSCLADDEAHCVWHDEQGRPTADILRDYVVARIADRDQRRFKVPAFRHPDPLRHPIYIDYGNSRWGISYAALEAAQKREKNKEKLAKARTDKTRVKLRQELESVPNLQDITLDFWNGERVAPLILRWACKRLWRDLDLANFGRPTDAKSVSRADRLGRIAAGQLPAAAVDIRDVFQQKDWNGRLQAPRDQLDRLADIVYGKRDGARLEPDFGRLSQVFDDARARKMWERLNWFLTTSVKLMPSGPWLDYVAEGLPEGIEFKSGRSGPYLNYAVNKGRKSQARLQLARLPGLRVLSLDLGHRYAAACVVWEAVSHDHINAACRDADEFTWGKNGLYLHVRRRTDRIQKSGRNKGKPVVKTVVYRRIGPDRLPDGTIHPAPWARLERQFLIKLQGEDRTTRHAKADEIAAVNGYRAFLGLPDLTETRYIDDLHRETVGLARLGLRRLGNVARVACAMTARQKPLAGGRMSDSMTPEQRTEHVLDALLWWQELAASNRYQDDWAREQWNSWVVETLGGPQPVEVDEDASHSDRRKKIDASREPLRCVAQQLADPASDLALELQQAWTKQWQTRSDQWKHHLRWLRQFVLPRCKDMNDDPVRIRRLGGLSVRRLQTIRDLYQVLKAFHMRPEPDDLRKNVPPPGDESMAKFGRRILNQLERLREQRIKQLASRVIEAALGGGRIKQSQQHDRRRPQARIDNPCHAVVVENLEHYRPDESRLRRENRQLMAWAARNVRKYIVEGCELHGLHFLEVPPAFTSRQDSRTGAPGIRCEEVRRDVFIEAARTATITKDRHQKTETQFDRDVRRLVRQIQRSKVKAESQDGCSPRDEVLVTVAARLADGDYQHPAIRLPRQGGEMFVSADPDSPVANGLQADLNAAANIGLRALMDPDWYGAWWFVLVNANTGQPVTEKVQGCPCWESAPCLLPRADSADDDDSASPSKTGRVSTKRPKTAIYAWNLNYGNENSTAGNWMTTSQYWEQVERDVCEHLRREQTQPENPF